MVVRGRTQRYLVFTRFSYRLLPTSTTSIFILRLFSTLHCHLSPVLYFTMSVPIYFPIYYFPTSRLSDIIPSTNCNKCMAYRSLITVIFLTVTTLTQLKPTELLPLMAIALKTEKGFSNASTNWVGVTIFHLRLRYEREIRRKH